MGSNEHPLAIEHPSLDLILKVGNGSADGILETFGEGKVLCIDFPVDLLQGGVSLIRELQGGRGHVKGTSPDMHLLFTVLVCRLALVQALQGAVVPLIELPALDDR